MKAGDAIGRYDRRTLRYTRTPVRLVAVACRACLRTIPPEDAERGEDGEWRCRDRAVCLGHQPVALRQ